MYHKEGGNMPESIGPQSLRLVYPPSLIHTPIIYLLIRRFDLSVNILRAHITEEEGWIDIQVTASLLEVEEALAWLRSQGIEIHTLSA
jgi:hypothetical protein